MLEQLRKKRLELIKTVGSRQRINSKQKRKAIEASLQQFQRQKFKKPASPVKSAQEFYKPQSGITGTAYNLLATHQQLPSFGRSDSLEERMKNDQNKNDQNKDDQKEEQNNLDADKQQKQQINQIQQPQFNQQTAKFHPSEQILPSIPQKVNKEQQEIVENSQQQPQIDRIQNKSQQKEQQVSQKKLKLQIVIDNLQQKVETQERQKNLQNKSPKRVKFDIPEFSGSIISPVNASSLVNNRPSNIEATYEKKQQNHQGLNFNYNDSHYGSSSNNSSAIFFTSQFKQYINRQNSPPKKTQQSDPKSEIHNSKVDKDDKPISQSFFKIGQGEDDVSEETESNHGKKKLKTDQSGRSLAFSASRNDEESLLKYSHANSSAVHQIVNKKLDEQLVLQIGDFSCKKITQLFNRYIILQQSKFKYFVHEIRQALFSAGRIINLCSRIKNISNGIVFDEILVYNQMTFENTKNQLKIQKFREQKEKEKIEAIIRQWKQIIESNETRIIGFQLRKDSAYKKNIFKVFKKIWYDNKVSKQADLYYLSKIFAAWRLTAQQQKRKDQHKALKQYCRSLKKIFFYKILQGVDNIRKQRQDKQAAEDFYRYSLIKKHFDAWCNCSSRQPQYISLAMTSKNTFKQTKNNKWLQTREINFVWKNVTQ